MLRNMVREPYHIVPVYLSCLVQIIFHVDFRVKPPWEVSVQTILSFSRKWRFSMFPRAPQASTSKGKLIGPGCHWPWYRIFATFSYLPNHAAYLILSSNVLISVPLGCHLSIQSCVDVPSPIILLVCCLATLQSLRIFLQTQEQSAFPLAVHMDYCFKYLLWRVKEQKGESRVDHIGQEKKEGGRPLALPGIVFKEREPPRILESTGKGKSVISYELSLEDEEENDCWCIGIEKSSIRSF